MILYSYLSIISLFIKVININFSGLYLVADLEDGLLDIDLTNFVKRVDISSVFELCV